MGRSQGGFTTCLAAHIAADGRMTVANAGHLPPYLNGEEVGVPGSLPLGIVSPAQYELTTLRSCARRPAHLRLRRRGRGAEPVQVEVQAGELFGFDRTRELSREPAASIAAGRPRLRPVGRHHRGDSGVFRRGCRAGRRSGLILTHRECWGRITNDKR